MASLLIAASALSLFVTSCAEVPPIDADAQRREDIASKRRAPEPDPALTPAAEVDLERRVQTWAEWLDSAEDQLFISGKTGLLRFPHRASEHFWPDQLPQSLRGRSAAYEIVLRFIFRTNEEQAILSAEEASENPPQPGAKPAQEGKSGARAIAAPDTEEEKAKAERLAAEKTKLEAEAQAKLDERKQVLATWLRSVLASELEREYPNDAKARSETLSVLLRVLSGIETLDIARFERDKTRPDIQPIIRTLDHPEWEVRRSVVQYLTAHPTWLTKSDFEAIARKLDADSGELRADAAATLLRLYRQLARSGPNGEPPAPITFNALASVGARQQQAARIREWIDTRCEAALERARAAK